MKIVAVLCTVMITSTGIIHCQEATSLNLWNEVKESEIILTGERFTFPSQYRTLHLDAVAMRNFLLQAPYESSATAHNTDGIIIAIPLPDGSFSRFRIVEYHVMHPDLAEQFPAIKTYTGQGIDDPFATIKLDITPLGFHSMILSPGGNFFIDPYCKGTTVHYICYDKKYLQRTNGFNCETNGVDDIDEQRSILQNSNIQKSSGTQLRTYRLALGCTGEYAATKGGTVAGALAGMTTSMNRVNGVYETEVAIRMVMVPNNNLIVFTNSITDPYTNNNGGTMLSQNQTTCDAQIGTANYDIGHVFSTGGGGVAFLGCVCGGSKAGGVTGLANPVGDAFDIDYVAHEIGHQFGGNHTFNSVTSSCGGGNRAASAAYEPGSGITIMAYAGICGADNLDLHSIAYFHTYSFDEIVNFSTTGNGNTCAVITNTGNTPPVVTSQGSNYTIPISTPFVLTGTATDADGDPLTYSWDQMNLGTAGAWNANLGTAPIFRPFAPVSSPSRTFPKLSDIINNTTTIGEILPNVARTMNFRLTARDNRAGGGGVMHPDVNVAITVVNSGGAFAVTAPNTAVSWPGGSTQTVTWNVNGTSGAPINCTSVKISLSTDGGNTFPNVLIASTPNDGTETIMVPNSATTTARVKVEALNNIFFDMSNANFTITAATGLTTVTTSTISPLSYCAGSVINVPFTINSTANAGNVFTAQLSNSAGSFASPVNIGSVSSTSATTIVATIPAATLTGTGYRIRVVSSNPVVTGSANTSNITISAQVGAAGVITSQSGNPFCANIPVVFSITPIPEATLYTWSVPPTGVIQSGQGTTSITVVFPPGQPDLAGNVTVFGSNANCTGASSILPITAWNSPLVSITGSTSFCSGSSTTLDAGPGNVTYQWSTGATTRTIIVNTAATFTVTVSNNPTTCFGTASVTTTVNPLPTVSFSGLASSYVVNEPAATLIGSPVGGTFSGNGISGNTFTPASAGVGGPYTITYSYTNANNCTNTSSQQTSVTTTCTIPAMPGTISALGGNTRVCPGDNKTYSIGNVAGATSYTWTVPPGASIGSGQGTTSIVVNYLAGFTASDSVKVRANNACGSSNYRFLRITRNTPSTPGSITGQNYGVCNLAAIPYSVTNVAGITYNWTFNTGNAAVASGQGTNSITANFAPAYTTGILSVTAANACGTSAARTYTVRATPATPASITGSTTVCVNQFGVPYSTAPIATATNYTWTVPTGARINDGTVTSTSTTLTTTATAVTVNYASTAGNVRVRANNTCGFGSYRSLAVTFTCRNKENTLSSGLNVSCYPLPADEIINVNFETTTASAFTINLIDILGKTVLTQSMTSVKGENRATLDLHNISNGIYMLEVAGGNNRNIQKIIVE